MHLNLYSLMFLLNFTTILILSHSYYVSAIEIDHNFDDEEYNYDYETEDNNQNSTELITESSIESLTTLLYSNDKINTQQLFNRKLGNFNFEKLMKIKLINDTVFKVNQKVSNFSNNVKSNIRAFIEESSQPLSQDLTKQLHKTLLGFVDSLELSPHCMMAFVFMKNGLMKGEFWPIKFFDAMEFIPSGVMDGALSSFGEYDECLDIENNPYMGVSIRGQYCLAKVPIPMLQPKLNQDKDNVSTHESPLKTKYFTEYKMDNNLLKLMQAINLFNISYYRMGLCIPSTCSAKEIERAVNKILSPMKKQVIEIETECKVKNQPTKLNPYQRTSISIFITLIILVLMSTSLELYYKYKRKSFGRKRTIKKSLLIFSMISNTRRLFVNDNHRLKCIDTILLFFITLEFLGRSYIQPVFHNLIGLKRSNVGITKEYFTSKKFFWMRNNAYAMSIFILMSSIMLAYNICGYKKKGKYNPINYLKYLVNRYLSLTRRIIGPILLLYILPLTGEGPMWHYFEQLHVQPCKQYLTQTLLFVNNYMTGFDKICNLPSATFSALFQLEVFAPLLLISLNFKPVGYILLTVLTIIGCYLSILQKLFFGLNIAPFEASTMNSIPAIRHSLVHYLGSTEQNISTFIIGLIYGYLIRKKPNLNTGGRLGNLILWVVFLSLPPIASYWSESFKAIEGGFSQISFIMWFLSGRVMWSLGYGWIIFACCTKRAGTLNRILSINALQPLARLAFGIYLNHLIIISYRLLNKKDTYIITHSDIFESAFIDYLIAIVISYIMFILIECPVYLLIKIISGTRNQNVSRSDDIEENNTNSNRKYSEQIEVKLFTQKN